MAYPTRIKSDHLEDFEDAKMNNKFLIILICIALAFLMSLCVADIKRKEECGVSGGKWIYENGICFKQDFIREE